MLCNLSNVREDAKLLATLMRKTFADRCQMIATIMQPINDILDWYPLLKTESEVYVLGFFDYRLYLLIIELNNV